MKKRWIGILMLICVLAVGGCGGNKASKQAGQKNIQDKKGQDIFPVLPTYVPGTVTGFESNEVLQNEGDAQTESAVRYGLASMLPFQEGDDKICAVAYMGDTGEEQEENLNAFYAKYFPSISSNSWEILPNFDFGGSQCYLVIPRYKDCDISLNYMELAGGDQLRIARTEYLFDEAFLLYCNPLEDFASSEITIQYNGGTFVIVPRLSSTDKRMEPMQVALDLTQEDVYTK